MKTLNNPERSSEVFDKLSKGNFICSNAVDSSLRNLYQYIEEHYNDLYNLYLSIGFCLECGNNYYYFSKKTEKQQGIESKIEKALRWLDILAFFTTFRKDLCRGARFSPHDILSQLDINLSLKDQLSKLQKRNSNDRNFHDMLSALLKEIQKEGFIDLENDLNQTWKILDSWDYMEQLVMAVSIEEEKEETTVQKN